MTPEEFDVLMAGTQYAAPSADEIAPGIPAQSGEAVVTAGAPNPEASTLGTIASDIGSGILEAPRAIAAGARNALQETGEFLVDAGNFVGSGIDKVAGLVGGAQGKDVAAPELPTIDAPKSVTGGLVSSVSQFVTGMIGAGKLTGPVKLAGSIGKAAGVGAVAFDPHGPRLADLVESIPGASNAVTQFLKSDPQDPAAMGRVKNALESIGMDVALIGGIAVSARLLKAVRSGDRAEIAAATREAGELRVGEASAPSSSTPPPTTLEAPPPAVAFSDTGVPRSDSIASPPLADGAVSPRQADGVSPLGDAAPRSPPKLLDLEDDAFGTLVDGIARDVDALSASRGSWDAAVSNGHVFGRGGRVPWQRLAQYGEDAAGAPSIDNQPVLALIGRTAEALETKHNAMRGGDLETGVRSDAESSRMLYARASLFNEDPAALFGMLEQAGTAARTMQANMEAGLLITQRGMQDSFALASRIRAGDLTEFGGDKAAALAALKEVVEIAATAYGHSSAMLSNAGRTLRRARSDFAFNPEQIAKIRNLDGDALASALERTGGDPSRLRQVLNPTMLGNKMDAAQWLLVNNLLWSPKTHFVNFMTNLYMVGVRPAERMIGSFGVKGPEGSRIFEEGWRQYTYLGGSLMDGWRSAVDAWKSGDSVLNPHAVEAFNVGGGAGTGGGIGQQVAQMAFKPWDSITNVLHNALLLPATKAIGLPTRALGTVDELVKQVVYRSKVQAEAHVAALRSGLDEAADINAYVGARLAAAFDDAGRATDLAALQEAKVATFQQDLLEGTAGKMMQTAGTGWAPLKIVVPFIKTPANVLRMGWKMTPGLNLAQTEYRQMIQGAMGPEMQAQAVGQMAVGSLFLGTASFMAASGAITGGGPNDPELLAELKATGWQPYSIVSRGEDGSLRYTNYGKFDPVAMPFGIVADLVEAMSLSLRQGDQVPEAIAEGALGALLGIMRQMADKSYLPSLNHAMDAIMHPERSFGRSAGQMVANYFPAGSGLRFWNPDPLLRDARDFTDHLRNATPGLSTSLPPKRDMWGDPIAVHKGLWVDAKTGIVDAEMRRMITEAEMAASRPGAMLEGQVDLRDVTMEDGRNAYDVYQERARQPGPDAKPIKEEVANIMALDEYRNAPDGSAKLKGTKLWMVYRAVSKYRDAAARSMRGDANVREALMEDRVAVADHYKNGGPPKNAGDKLMEQLGNVGKAFGVNLGRPQ